MCPSFLPCSLEPAAGEPSAFASIDVDAAVRFILRSFTHEGGFGQSPGEESHGGATYCALASLSLFNRLDSLPDPPRCVRYLVNLQMQGFVGRTNKSQDTCYTWWVGASLRIMKAHQWLDSLPIVRFLFKNENLAGGFRKDPDTPYPDILHSYFSLAGMSIFEPAMKLEEIVPELGLTKRAVETPDVSH